MDEIQRTLLEEVADLHGVPAGAYNIRANGQMAGRQNTANIEIVTKGDQSGIEIRIKEGTKHESVHIPVVLSQSGLKEMVYNDFYIGAGDGRGARILNPTTEVTMEEGSYLEMESVQIKGVDSTVRSTVANLAAGASIVIKERLLTHGSQRADSTIKVNLNGADASANVLSRSVAREESSQKFISIINGNSRCAGHTECDAIIMDQAKIQAVPELTANDPDAALIHEAAIGKIAGEQLIKLMTLGLTEEEAEAQIINGFLK